MSKSLMLGAMGAGTVSNNSYGTVGGYMNTALTGGTQGTEANFQNVIRVAGVMSLLAVQANATGTSRTVQFRVNTANGNQVITPTNTTAGVYADTTHTDTLASGDKHDLKFTNTGSPTYAWMRQVFAATTDTAGFVVTQRQNAYSSGTQYTGPSGYFITTTTESLTKARIRAGGSAQNLVASTQNQSNATNSTLTSRKNGADGNLTVSVPNNVSGTQVEDTTHSDTLAAGDDYNFKNVLASGSGGLEFLSYAVVNSSNTKTDGFGGSSSSSGDTRFASGTATYYMIGGSTGLNTGSTESGSTIQHGFAVTASNIRILVTTSNIDAGCILKSRNNAADGTQTVTLTASTTGVFEDTTHSDNVAATDAFCYAIVGGKIGSITYYWIGATEQEQSNDTNVAITGNAATGSPGSLTSSSVQSVAITGNTGTGSPGTLSPAASFALSGNQATGAVGSLTSSSVQSVALTGNAATGGVGSLTPSLSLALTGNSATGSPGTLVPSAGGSIALTGVSGTGAVGDLASSMVVSKAITGNAATGAVGSLGKTFSIALTGNAGTGSPGTLTPLTGTVVALTGVFGTGAVGDLGAYAAPVLRFIPQIQNLSQTQDQINAILAVIYGAMPGYGDALPAVTGQVDGRLFTLTTTNKLYQLQAGFWVALT